MTHPARPAPIAGPDWDAPPMGRIAEVALAHGWRPIPARVRRVLWERETEREYRRVEITTDEYGAQPAAATVLRRPDGEDHTVDFHDARDPRDLTDAILAVLRSAQ